jgi:hypothetical protein
VTPWVRSQHQKRKDKKKKKKVNHEKRKADYMLALGMCYNTQELRSK